jgi:hypothetical protein
VEVANIIKRTNDYITFSTDRLLFLDMKNYVAAGVSYANFLKASEVEGEKLHWPHDWFDSLEKLKTPYLVEQEHFWSDLRQEGISDSDYAKLDELWRARGFTSMRDLLVEYNNAG